MTKQEALDHLSDMPIEEIEELMIDKEHIVGVRKPSELWIRLLIRLDMTDMVQELYLRRNNQRELI